MMLVSVPVVAARCGKNKNCAKVTFFPLPFLLNLGFNLKKIYRYIYIYIDLAHRGGTKVIVGMF